MINLLRQNEKDDFVKNDKDEFMDLFLKNQMNEYYLLEKMDGLQETLDIINEINSDIAILNLLLKELKNS